jgi:hypothetical protein
MWSPKGDRLFYVRGPAPGESKSIFYSVDVLPSGTSFETSKDKELFALGVSEQLQVSVIVNLFAELTRNVPAN